MTGYQKEHLGLGQVVMFFGDVLKTILVFKHHQCFVFEKKHNHLT